MKTQNVITNDKRVEFLGLYLDLLTMQETLCQVEGIINSRQVTQHVVVNVAKLVHSQSNKELKDIINSCPLINVDGMGVVWGAKILGVNIPERVAGIDLMQELINSSAKKGHRIYFFGATEEVITQVVEKYKKEFPNLQVAGFRNGYYSDEEEASIAQEIKNSNADILFVAMGSPKKEMFLNKYQEDMQVPFIMGVGGSFDVVAQKVKRAPLWMQNWGLEWFYRLIQEPRRMWKRYLVTNTLFLFLILKQFVRQKLNLVD